MSLSNDLVRRSIQQSNSVGGEAFSPENIFMAEYASFENLLGRYHRVHEAVTAVQALSEQFFAEHKNGVTFHQAKLFEMSVESIFRATGEDIPMRDLLVSFEQSYDYSTEAENKVKNAAKAIGTWLMEMLNKLSTALKSMLNRFNTAQAASRAKLEKRLAELKEKRGKKDGKSDDATAGKKDDKVEPSTEAKGTSVEVADIKILGGTGVSVATTIDKAQANTRKAATDMLGVVRAVSEAAKRFNPQKHSSKDGLDDFMKDIMLSAGMERGENGGKREFQIVNGTGAQIVFNRKSDATVTAKAGKIPYEKQAGRMPGLSLDEGIRLIEHLLKAHADVESIRKPMDTVAGVFAQMAKSMSEGYQTALRAIGDAKDKEDAEKAASVSRVYSTLGHVLQALGSLPSNILMGYMQVQFAADKYADQAVR